mmetsp:Transcript_9067/g.33862  ORF Transcript_9067/g.33862 Transcript_9067/m.33862 type:complete len:306 (-) Transcript_9067:205-1122(-)
MTIRNTDTRRKLLLAEFFPKRAHGGPAPVHHVGVPLSLQKNLRRQSTAAAAAVRYDGRCEVTVCLFCDRLRGETFRGPVERRVDRVRALFSAAVANRRASLLTAEAFVIRLHEKVGVPRVHHGDLPCHVSCQERVELVVGRHPGLASFLLFFLRICLRLRGARGGSVRRLASRPSLQHLRKRRPSRDLQPSCRPEVVYFTCDFRCSFIFGERVDPAETHRRVRGVENRDAGEHGPVFFDPVNRPHRGNEIDPAVNPRVVRRRCDVHQIEPAPPVVLGPQEIHLPDAQRALTVEQHAHVPRRYDPR